MTFWMRKTNDRCGSHGAEHRRPEKGMAGATWQETQIYAKPALFTARRAVQ